MKGISFGKKITIPKKEYFVILFHPETLTNVSTLDQINTLLHALQEFSDYYFVFLGTNADTNSNIIRKTVKDYVEKTDNTCYFENLHTDAYHYLVQNSICLIGNSSSGIIEAPSLGVYTVNIGDRQKGRVRGNSVIDAVCSIESIKNSINKVLKYYNSIKPINPYYKDNSAKLYYHTTKTLLERIEKDIEEPKIFYDLQ